MKGPLHFVSKKADWNFEQELVDTSDPRELKFMKHVTELGAASFSAMAAISAYGLAHSRTEVITHSSNIFARLGATVLNIGFNTPEIFLVGVGAAVTVEMLDLRHKTVQRLEGLDS